MRRFKCQCGAWIFFDNTSCVACKRMLGYLPDQKTMSAVEPTGREEEYRAFASPGVPYRQCRNYAQLNVCNWMVRVDDDSPYCIACQETADRNQEEGTESFDDLLVNAA